ncbi:aconitate B N-terminal domain protein [Bordetella bronchiseptica B18-5 (C3)]|nr:aconitate B N-terminal domain protein [Bordetella bronchiseptica B18-5 (C3)]
MLETYRQHVADRAALGIPPLPLSAQQTADLIELLKNPPDGEAQNLLELLTYRVPAGVDDAAKVKASYLAAVAFGTESCALIDRAGGHGHRKHYCGSKGLHGIPPSV